MKKWMLMVGALASGLAVTAYAADKNEELAKAKGCFACHTVDKKVVGPAYKEVAAKYAGQADAVAKLAVKVQKGGSGVWGAVPMPPNNVTPAEAKALVTWILKHK